MNILYLTILTAYLFLPGAAIANAVQIQRNALTAIAISYSLFVVIYVVSNQLGLSTNTFFSIVSATLVISAVACTIEFYIKRKEISLNSNFLYVLGIVLCVFIYHGLQGAFAEVPSDLYAHLERFQFARSTLQLNDSLTTEEWENLLTSKSRVWYHLLAVVAIQTSATGIEVLELSAAVTNSVFLIAVYFFGTSIFKESQKPMLVAALATGFTAIHFGINIFSFIRYYSLAPSILGFCLYFFAIDLIVKLTSADTTGSKAKYISLITAVTFAATINHTQEGLFIAVTLTLMSIINVLRFNTKPLKNQPAVSSERYTWNAISVLTVIAFLVIYVYANVNFSRAPNIGWRLWVFNTSDGLLPGISILNLKFQFIQVVTLWGLFVYGLFVLNIARYKHNAFILAGMISPAFTVMNPFFVDLFLRLDNSTTLWRLCYIIPIHYVAADLFIFYATKLSFKKTKDQVNTVLILLPLLLLLLPIQNTWEDVHYSRFSTLNKPPKETSYHNYKDLLTYLETLDEPHKILTDPMLGYMVSGLTPHYSERKKFFRGARFKRFSYLDYSDRPIDKYAGHLLITNKRTTVLSPNGQLGGHWRPNEWNETKNYYPQALYEHIAQRPKAFKLLWSNDGVSVFKITP